MYFCTYGVIVNRNGVTMSCLLIFFVLDSVDVQRLPTRVTSASFDVLT